MELSVNEKEIVVRLLLDYEYKLKDKIKYYEKSKEQTKLFTSKDNYNAFADNLEHYRNQLNEINLLVDKL